MESFLLAFVPLFVAIDPIGLVPFFLTLTEGFLSQCLGGRAEPIGNFAGSSISVPTGAAGVPGLVEVMKEHKQVVRK